jgi:hypothetical protein
MKKILLLIALCGVLVNTYSINITGEALLDNSADHSGIKIEFIPESPSAQSATTFSNENGSFSVELLAGIYTVEYSKTNYQTYLLEDPVLFSGDSQLASVTLSSEPLNLVSGDVYGTWKVEDGAYSVAGNINVPSGRTLTIEPGVEIRFSGNYKINIYGKLIASGTPAQNIVFTSGKSAPAAGDWEGIFIYGSEISKIEHAILEYGGSEENSKAIVNVENLGKLQIYNCVVRYSDRGGIYVQFGAQAWIKDNYVSDMSRGILCNANSTAEITSNTAENCNFYGLCGSSEDAVIKYNSAFDCAVGIMSESNLTISYNLLYNNESGVYPRYGNPNFENNTFYGNTYGVELYDDENRTVNIEQNIFVNNNYAIYKPTDRTSIPESISFNVFFNNSRVFNGYIMGLGQLITTNHNGDDSDAYYNLLDNPEFTSSDTNNDQFLELMPSSIAIDAGNPNQTDEDGSIVDIGAKVFASTVTRITQKQNSESKAFYAFFDRTNDFLVLKRDASQKGFFQVKIFSMTGRQVYSENINQAFSTKISLSRFPGGVYLVSILNNNGEFVFSKKVLK